MGDKQGWRQAGVKWWQVKGGVMRFNRHVLFESLPLWPSHSPMMFWLNRLPSHTQLREGLKPLVAAVKAKGCRTISDAVGRVGGGAGMMGWTG